MSASVKSLARVSMITTYNQGGGPKKQGLAPNATFFFKAPYTGNNYRSRTYVNSYPIRGAIPKSWHNYRVVGSTTIINGMRVMM